MGISSALADRGGVERADNSNSAASLAAQDFSQQAHDLALSYGTPKGSRLSLQVRRTSTEFPQPQVLAAVPPFFLVVADNSYTQTEYNLLGDWRVSGKLTMRGQAGWVNRSYDNILRNNYNGFAALVPRPDFSGFAGRIRADWYATGKTLLSMSLYQELAGAQDINASSVLNRGASLSAVWLTREKWRLNAGLTFENRDFRGDPGSGLPQRNDDTWGSTLSLSYVPIRAVSLDLGLAAGWRDSNMSVDNYEFRTVFASVRADF